MPDDAVADRSSVLLAGAALCQEHGVPPLLARLAVTPAGDREYLLAGFLGGIVGAVQSVIGASPAAAVVAELARITQQVEANEAPKH
jgi:hypothetical protein